MKTHTVLFQISGDNKIVLEIEGPVEEVHCCYEASITLYYENRKFNGGYISLREYLLNNVNSI